MCLTAQNEQPAEEPRREGIALEEPVEKIWGKINEWSKIERERVIKRESERESRMTKRETE